VLRYYYGYWAILGNTRPPPAHCVCYTPYTYTIINNNITCKGQVEEGVGGYRGLSLALRPVAGGAGVAAVLAVCAVGRVCCRFGVWGVLGGEDILIRERRTICALCVTVCNVYIYKIYRLLLRNIPIPPPPPARFLNGATPWIMDRARHMWSGTCGAEGGT